MNECRKLLHSVVSSESCCVDILIPHNFLFSFTSVNSINNNVVTDVKLAIAVECRIIRSHAFFLCGFNELSIANRIMKVNRMSSLNHLKVECIMYIDEDLEP